MFRNTRLVELSKLVFPAVLGTMVIVAPASAGSSSTKGLAKGHANAMGSTVHYELAAVRRATAHLHRFENAAPAGWDAQVTGCLENPPAGGMGYHYGNFDFYLDGLANVLEPEVLLYEPQSNGELRLVAVEYAVPLFAWQGPGEPVLFGREMNWDPVHEEWTLHAWIWKHNPAGIFEDWNPAVTCEFAD